MKKVLDLSHWNNVRDWGKLKDPVILKATQGTSFVDPKFKEYREEAKRRGLYLGCYHFANGTDAVKEAKHFLNHADGDLLVLDWETSHADPAGWCRNFLDYVKQRTGKTPYLYTNEARANKINNSYPWWIARYGTNNGQPQKEPTKDWKIWQYTSKGRIDGIDGYVDLNQCKDGLCEATGGPTTPVPPEMDISYYWQRNPRYRGVKLGRSNYSFQDYGCFVCSLAYCAKRDPLEVNKFLADNGGMTAGGLIITPKAYELLGFKYIRTDRNIAAMPKETPTIKEVNLGRSQHFTVRLIDKTHPQASSFGTFIFDPWTGKYLPINYYSFRSYRIFTT